MTNIKLGRWLLVAIAIVALVFAAPVASAHSTDTTADEAPTANATADDWTVWMETQMTEHMGPASIEWMESQMGVTVGEMGQDMADEEYHNGVNVQYPGEMNRQDHC